MGHRILRKKWSQDGSTQELWWSRFFSIIMFRQNVTRRLHLWYYFWRHFTEKKARPPKVTLFSITVPGWICFGSTFFLSAETFSFLLLVNFKLIYWIVLWGIVPPFPSGMFHYLRIMRAKIWLELSCCRLIRCKFMRKDVRLTVSSTGHCCNEGRISRSIWK